MRPGCGLQAVDAGAFGAANWWLGGGRVGEPLYCGHHPPHTIHAFSVAFSAPYAKFLHKNLKHKTQNFTEIKNLKFQPTGRNLQTAAQKDKPQMTNIVPLKPKADPMIWTCGECGCQTFYLYNDDSTECALCGCRDAQLRGRWLETLKDDETVPEDIPLRTNVVHASAEFARKSTLKSVSEDTVMIAILQRDGRIKAWSEINQGSTPEQQDWLRRTMAAATALTLGEPARTDDYPK